MLGVRRVEFKQPPGCASRGAATNWMNLTVGFAISAINRNRSSQLKEFAKASMPELDMYLIDGKYRVPFTTPRICEPGSQSKWYDFAKPIVASTLLSLEWTARLSRTSTITAKPGCYPADFDSHTNPHLTCHKDGRLSFLRPFHLPGTVFSLLFSLPLSHLLSFPFLPLSFQPRSIFFYFPLLSFLQLALLLRPLDTRKHPSEGDRRTETRR